MKSCFRARAKTLKTPAPDEETDLPQYIHFCFARLFKKIEKFGGTRLRRDPAFQCKARVFVVVVFLLVYFHLTPHHVALSRGPAASDAGTGCQLLRSTGRWVCSAVLCCKIPANNSHDC